MDCFPLDLMRFMVRVVAPGTGVSSVLGDGLFFEDDDLSLNPLFAEMVGCADRDPWGSGWLRIGTNCERRWVDIIIVLCF